MRSLLWTLSRPALVVVLAVVTACADHVDARVELDLRIHVAMMSGDSAGGLSVYLKDLDPHLKRQPVILQRPICQTAEDGTCQARVSYSYGYSKRQWLTRLYGAERSAASFEVRLERSNNVIFREAIPHVDGSQIAGVSPLELTLKVGSKAE